MAELAARDAGAQAETAHADAVHGAADLAATHGFEIVLALGHGAHEDGAALPVAEAPHVLCRADDGRLCRERRLAAPRGEVARDGAGHDLEQFLRGGGGADGEAVEELDHQAGEALERAGEADGGADGDERVVGGGDVDLEEAGFVEGGVEEGEEALLREGRDQLRFKGAGGGGHACVPGG